VWVASTSKRAADDVERSRTLDDAYGEARDQVGAEDFWVTEYMLLLTPDFEEHDPAALRRSHGRAAVRLTNALERARRRGTPSDRALTANLLAHHERYLASVQRLFAAVDAGDKRRALAVELGEIDPGFSFIETRVERASISHRRTAERTLSQLDRVEHRSFAGTLIAFPIGMLLVGLLAGILRRYRRDEITRLQAAALTDNLTGLGNHRAFQERLQSDVARHRRSQEPLSLVILDLDGLKQVNDTRGHPVGDRQLMTLAARLGSTARESDGVFRIGGDEFAAILPGATAWRALRFVQRAQSQLGDTQATAGICELSGGMLRDELIQHADQALLEAKRSHRESLIYTESLQPPAGVPSDSPTDRHHIQTLATALARAVDAKDSWTRSHCETVSALCVLIAEELGLAPELVESLRIAGLVHDVGKIGIADAILQKPGPLTDDEYEVMKTHSTLGERIVAGADLTEQAAWIRSHHERPDGRGYPDGLSGDVVSLPSRIILVADAFEAMTADRPYRKSMPETAAFAELERHSGTQFDPGCVDALRRALGARGQPRMSVTSPRNPGSATSRRTASATRLAVTTRSASRGAGGEPLDSRAPTATTSIPWNRASTEKARTASHAGPTVTKSGLSARSGSTLVPASTRSSTPNATPPARPGGSSGRTSA
jgi:diguanylate cyclase (GGDEF)-like protein